MSSAKKYRQCAAAILLLLYAFIATPVGLWHHHDMVKQPGRDTGREQRIFTQNNKAFNDSNCPVCQHQYSVYHDAVVIPVIPGVTELSSQNGHYVPVLTLFPSFPSQNKGPPCLF